MNLQGIKGTGSQFLSACTGFMLQHPLPIIAGGTAVTVAIVCIAKRQFISRQVTRAYTSLHTNVYRKFMDSSRKAKLSMVITAVAVIAVIAVGVLAVRKKQAAAQENSIGAILTPVQNPVPAANADVNTAKEADPVVDSTSKDPVSAKETQNKKEAVKEKEKEKEKEPVKEAVKEPVAEKEKEQPAPMEKPVEKVEKETKKEDKKPVRKKPAEKAPVVKEKQEDVVAKPAAEEKPTEPAQPAIAEEKPAPTEPAIAEGKAPIAATEPVVVG